MKVGPGAVTIRELTPAPERPLPSLGARIKNYAKSTARHVAAGMPEASPEEKARRLEICRGSATVPRCGKYRPSDGACAGCGCPLEAKAARALDYCPDKKW